MPGLIKVSAYNEAGAVITTLKGELLDAMDEQQRALQMNAQANAEAQCALSQGSAVAQINAGQNEAKILESQATESTTQAATAIGSAAMGTVLLAKMTASTNKLMTESRNLTTSESVLTNPRQGANGILAGGNAVDPQHNPQVAVAAKGKIQRGEALTEADLAGCNQQELAELRADVKTRKDEIERKFKDLQDRHAMRTEWQRAMAQSGGFVEAIEKRKQADFRKEVAKNNALAELYRGLANPTEQQVAQSIDALKKKQDEKGSIVASLTDALKTANEYRG